MEKLLAKYADKLAAQGLCDRGDPVLGGLDAELVWNTDDARCDELGRIVAGLNINSILFAQPAEPYRSIIEMVTRDVDDGGSVRPEDSETRTFLHDIPVVRGFDQAKITAALKKRKGVIVPGHGIVTFGTVSPEQAFVTFSSICFSSYVKFFSDYIMGLPHSAGDGKRKALIRSALASYGDFIEGSAGNGAIVKGPFVDADSVVRAMIQAGRLTVDCRLVDSFFGNISARLGDTIYISQTGSSLDELAGCIDPCPTDGSSCAGLTASSEYSAHSRIYETRDCGTILHGHPKFSVIMSMICERRGSCENSEVCYKRCSDRRFVNDIPVIPGEVGTGQYGISSTLPPAIKTGRGAIIYGHGLFTVGKEDFTDAFENLLGIEKMCVEEYLKKI